jgi:hypothetical protein
MNRILFLTAFAVTLFLTACGTSSREPNGGSMAQTMSGVNPNGYPGGKPLDAHSPALSSSSETQHSRDQDAEKQDAEKKQAK